MTDKTDKPADRSIRYRSPEAKEIHLTTRSVLCGSIETEKYGMSVYSYNEEDWE